MDYCIGGRGAMIYKTVPSYPAYEVDKDGRVRNRATKKELQRFENVNGYIVVALWVDDRAIHRRVHRLVMEAWVGPPPFDKAEVNHIDGNKKNNRLSNLEYVTKLENREHAIREGLIKRGEEASGRKLTEEKVIEIRELHFDGGISLRDLALMFDVSQEAIVKIIKDRNWRHVG